MENVLITGATGFVGSHALLELEKQNDIQLIAACRNTEKLPANISATPITGDLRNPAYRAAIVKNTDILVHAAAWTALFAHKDESFELFLEPTIALIDEARKAGVKRFIFVSSNSAASPDQSADANNPGKIRKLWPHLDNVVRIENYLREVAHDFETVINLRFGLFVGQRYNLGLLPILLPRLKTHLVPWVGGGNTDMPLIDGRDIGLAIRLAATTNNLHGFESFNILGPEKPTVRDVIEHLHEEHGYPKPHFNVPFWLAYPFARFMEILDPLMPWDPLVTRSIIHLLEDTKTDNTKATKILGYHPTHHWHDSVDTQIEEMKVKQKHAMRMHVEVT